MTFKLCFTFPWTETEKLNYEIELVFVLAAGKVTAKPQLLHMELNKNKVALIY